MEIATRIYGPDGMSAASFRPDPWTAYTSLVGLSKKRAIPVPTSL